MYDIISLVYRTKTKQWPKYTFVHCHRQFLSLQAALVVGGAEIVPRF